MDTWTTDDTHGRGRVDAAHRTGPMYRARGSHRHGRRQRGYGCNLNVSISTFTF
jgi:hypothetical protein